MSDGERCVLTPGCTFPSHDATEHPCGIRHLAGDPCQFCGDPLKADAHGGVQPCPKCWTSLAGLPLADIKGLLALGDLSVGSSEVSDGR